MTDTNNGKRFIYDIETNGLLDRMDTIHCLVMYDLDTQELHSFRNDGHPDNLARLEEGARLLNNAAQRIGHNIIGFDEPAMKIIFPWFNSNEPGKVLDTLILTRLIWPAIADTDTGRVKRGQLEGRLIGSHSLDAWGQRIGEWKGDFSKELQKQIMAENPDLSKQEAMHLVWATWTQEMQDYCDQDVLTNLALYRHCQRKGYAARAVKDEMDVAVLCKKIEENGFPFNEQKAASLYATLSGHRARLEADLKDTFGSWVVPSPVKRPSAPNKALGYDGVTTYVWLDNGEPIGEEWMTPKGLPNAAAKREGVKRVFEGYPYTPIKIVEFNPSSRFHIADRLKVMYGWEPQEYTKSGEPKIDEEVMAALPYECGPLLTEYFTVIKRIGQLAEGKQAWLQAVRDGKIHGRYNTVGAVTRRMTHSSPNIAQVPSLSADYGQECRELFGPSDGWIQVGTDASGLELRMLAHFMAKWDNGEYADVILHGDIHSVNQEAAGLSTRNDAKTFIYAFLYGAGDGKIGSIVGGSSSQGKALRAQFMAQLPALGNLVTAVKHKSKMHKHLLALDGGVLHVRSDHSALNVLLQSAGALVCKKWSVELERVLLAQGFKHGWDGDFVFLATIHDELQIACRTPEIADAVEAASITAMTRSQEYYGIRIKLDVDSKRGSNWADCH